MSMMLNTCKFLENGGLESGYILKPQWMRSDGFKTIKDFKIITLQFTLKIMIAYNLKVLDVFIILNLRKKVLTHKSKLVLEVFQKMNYLIKLKLQ